MDDENVLDGVSTPPVVEKTHTQDDLDRIVKREKAEIEARVRQELESAHRAELDKLRTGQTANLGGMKESVNEDAVRSQVASLLQEQMKELQDKQAQANYEAELKRVADNYFSKIRSGKDGYSDFDEIVGDFKHDAFPQLVWALSGMENAADILYELNKNPSKLEQIDYWLNKVPEKGMDMLNKLGQSILETRNAQDTYEPTKPPIHQIKQSNVGLDNGKMTLEDYKQADWNRF